MLLYMNYQHQQQIASDTYQIKYSNHLNLIIMIMKNDNDPDFNFYNEMSQNRTATIAWNPLFMTWLKN